jgi:hypothetical protein
MHAAGPNFAVHFDAVFVREAARETAQSSYRFATIPAGLNNGGPPNP